MHQPGFTAELSLYASVLNYATPTSSNWGGSPSAFVQPSVGGGPNPCPGQFCCGGVDHSTNPPTCNGQCCSNMHWCCADGTCDKQCTPGSSGVGSTGSSGGLSVLCELEYGLHPIYAEIMEGVVKKAHDAGITKDKCNAIASTAAQSVSATISLAPPPFGVIFGIASGADLTILGNCLCDEYYG